MLYIFIKKIIQGTFTLSRPSGNSLTIGFSWHMLTSNSLNKCIVMFYVLLQFLDQNTEHFGVVPNKPLHLYGEMAHHSLSLIGFMDSQTVEKTALDIHLNTWIFLVWYGPAYNTSVRYLWNYSHLLCSESGCQGIKMTPL